MKLRPTIFLLLLVTVLFTCRTHQEPTVENKFIACLPIEAQEDFQLLLTSFDNFLQKDYNGSIEAFTQTIIDLNLSDKINHAQDDIILGRQLMKNNFNQYIYSTYNDSIYYDTFSKIKGETEKKLRIKKLLRLDKTKPYLSCLLKVMPNDDLIRAYLKEEDSNSVLVVIQDFAWKPGYDISKITQSGMLRIMLATELYSGILMRSK